MAHKEKEVEKNPLEALELFAAEYPQYPENIYCVWRIFRDLQLKDHYVNLQVVDGRCLYGYNQYLLRGDLKRVEHCTTRVILPINIDDDIDLKRMHDFVQICARNGSEVYAAIYSSENIVYQSVTSEMP